MDGDGTINRHEFHEAVQSLGFEGPEQVPDIVFNEFDADGSGAVDYSEWLLKMLRDGLARNRRRLLDLFREWDSDNSGAVDKAEFAEGIRKAGFDAHQSEVDAIFDDLDADGSGELEYVELQAKLSVWAGVERVPTAGYYDL